MTGIVWLIGGGVLLLIEFWTADLLFASLGVSALAAALAGYLGSDWLVSSVVFALVALVNLVLLRPIGLRAMRRNDTNHVTNVAALIGLESVPSVDITTMSGIIKLRGEDWSARTDSGTIPAGTPVVVTRIDGAGVIVSRKEKA